MYKIRFKIFFTCANIIILAFIFDIIVVNLNFINNFINKTLLICFFFYLQVEKTTPIKKNRIESLKDFC